MSKKKTLEEAKKEITKKFNHLKLLEFYGNSNKALFFDKKYGKFYKTYNNVLAGNSGHPERGKISRLKKRKKTMIEKYGVEHAAQHISFKEKTKQTNLEKYGVENPQQNKDIKEKTKQTNLKRYGYENPLQNEGIKAKIKQTNLLKYGSEYGIQSEEIKNKRQQTNLKKYGVEHTLQNKNIRNKIKQTNLEKYGYENPLQNKDIKEKTKQTNLEKYGVEHPIQNKNIKEKIKQTNLKKYGCTNPQQNKQIVEKTKNTKIKNGIYNNINGKSLFTFYNTYNLNIIRTYACVQQNYKKFGNIALNKNHYNNLHGKSKAANLWLKSIENKLGYALIKEFHVPTTLYHADGYDPKTNTIYEFYGDYWHGNLNKFAATDIHPIKEVTYQELYYNTIKKENVIKSLGYNMVYIWENDFNDLNI